MIRDNEMHEHEMSEVEVRSNGAPLMADNRIHDSKCSGILVDAAGGEFHRNDIYRFLVCVCLSEYHRAEVV
jgi:hypothetical protein